MVFWTVRFEFPQRVVCLLLNMLPDNDYKVSTFAPYDSYWQNIMRLHSGRFCPRGRFRTRCFDYITAIMLFINITPVYLLRHSWHAYGSSWPLSCLCQVAFLVKDVYGPLILSTATNVTIILDVVPRLKLLQTTFQKLGIFLSLLSWNNWRKLISFPGLKDFICNFVPSCSFLSTS
jgi:hypothetical protein